MREVLETLRGDLRALRTLQAPEQVQFDPAVDQWVTSSAAFKQQSDGTISVDLEEVLRLDGHPLTYGYPRVARAVGMVAHTVGRLTTDGFAVTHDPLEETEEHEENDYHGIAQGKLSSAKRGRLADTCEIIIPIEGDVAQRHHDEKLARQAQKAIDAGRPPLTS